MCEYMRYKLPRFLLSCALSVFASQSHLSQRESQGLRLVTKVLGIPRKFPAVLLPLPLGEVDLRSKDGEGAGQQGLREFIPHIFTHFLRYCINVCKIVSISRIIMHKY